jgi:uncharacterized membrane protein YjjP (DUF1212 family)
VIIMSRFEPDLESPNDPGALERAAREQISAPASTDESLLQAFSNLKEAGRDDSPSVATIDVAQAPPLAPLAPVDTSDRDTVMGVFDIVSRICEIHINAGVTVPDSQAQARAMLQSFGLWNVHIDLTARRIRLYTQATANIAEPVVLIRVMPPAEQDFDKLIKVDNLVRDILAGRTNIVETQERLLQIETEPRPFGLHTVVLSWGIMGAAVALLIGGDLLVATLSYIAATGIMYLQAFLDRKSLPYFFQNVAGGIFASMLAAVSYHAAADLGITLRPSLVIATSIVTMVAGLTLVQALQNGVASAPVTAYARFFDTIINTSGIVAGVGLGILIAELMDMSLPPIETLAPPNFSSDFIRVAGSVGATAAFARACYANWSATVLSAATAGVASALYYYALVPLEGGGVFSTALTAILIGLLGGLWARRYRVPPLIIMIAGVTPLLPGITIYRGMYGILHDQLIAGFANLTIAFVTAAALSAGVVFGEFFARKLRRPRGLSKYTVAIKRMGYINRRRQFRRAMKNTPENSVNVQVVNEDPAMS